MNIFDILNNLSNYGISPSSIPSNISSNILLMTNHQIVNEISKLKAKLSTDNYSKANALYKKVIKPINITFIKSLYTMQNYVSNNNYDPLTDFDYLYDQYDKNTVKKKNPAIYKLLKENLLQRNLFKYIIIMHYSNKTENNKSGNNIYYKIIDILKKYIGAPKKKSPGIMKGGKEPVLTEEQKKSLLASVVILALSIDESRNEFLDLVKEVDNSNSKEIIKRIEEVVANKSIPIDKRPFHTAWVIDPSSATKDEKEIMVESTYPYHVVSIPDKNLSENYRKLEKEYKLLLERDERTQSEIKKLKIERGKETIAAALPSSVSESAKVAIGKSVKESVATGVLGTEPKVMVSVVTEPRPVLVRATEAIEGPPPPPPPPPPGSGPPPPPGVSSGIRFSLVKAPAKRVEEAKDKTDKYFEDIKEWIKNKKYNPGDTQWAVTHPKYRPSEKKFFEDSRDKIREYVIQINEINENLSSIPANKLVEEAVKAEELLAIATYHYEAVNLKYKEFKKNELAKLKESATPKVPLFRGKKDPDDDLITHLEKIEKKTLQMLVQITFRNYRSKLKKVEELLNKVSEPSSKDKINSNLSDIQKNIENAREKVLKLEKKSEDDTFKGILKKIDKTIQDTYENALKTVPSVGGSLFYFKKYMKYKSKYLQIK